MTLKDCYFRVLTCSDISKKVRYLDMEKGIETEIGLCHTPRYIGHCCAKFHLNQFSSFCKIEPQTNKKTSPHFYNS